MPPPKLLDQVRSRLRVKHYSIRTVQAYVDWIKRFIWCHGKRHPYGRILATNASEPSSICVFSSGQSEGRFLP
jgi:hypothetical protein